MVETGKGRRAVSEPTKREWWVLPSIAGSCILAVVLALLHLHFGTSSTPSRAAVAAVANVAVLLIAYCIFRKVKPRHGDTSLSALLASLAVSLPVFAVAFVGLGYEVAELADIGGMYILGVWIGSAEATGRTE